MVLFVPKVSMKLSVIPQRVVVFFFSFLLSASLFCRHLRMDYFCNCDMEIFILDHIMHSEYITDSTRMLFKQQVTPLACCGANLVSQLILILILKTISTLLLQFQSEDSTLCIVCRVSPPRHNVCPSTLGILLVLLDHIISKPPMVEGYI